MSEAARVLDLWSRGLISSEEACRRTGTWDGAALLIMAAARGVPPSMPPQEEVARQAETFAVIWRDSA